MKKLAAVASLMVFLSSGQVFAQEAGLKRTLRLGSFGEDVRQLQIILNRSPLTRVSQSGAGSPGQESAYFGLKTLSAVMRFQELYAKEVLVPAQLTRPSGIVGPLTRAKLMVAGSSTASGAGAPAITSVLPANLPPGAVLTISGLGLSAAGNTVKLGERKISEITNYAIDSLSFRIPTDVLPGLYDITITAPSGAVSNARKVLITGVVAGGIKDNAPTITSISPTRGGYGTTITITGSGFSQSSANTLYVGYDKLTGLASKDGKTLTFTIPSVIPHINFKPEHLLSVPNASLPFWIYVQNSSGESNAELFTFTFYN